MKILQPAALALMGWLLLTPPYVRNGKFDSNAPLSSWTEAAEFGSQAECEDYRHHVRPKEDLARNGQKGVINEAAEAKLRLRGQCVSADDPRLQKN
jgi:hypothetical protein